MKSIAYYCNQLVKILIHFEIIYAQRVTLNNETIPTSSAICIATK